MATYPVCQSHTGRLTGLWFLPKPAFGLNTNDDDEPLQVIHNFIIFHCPHICFPPKPFEKLQAFLRITRSVFKPGTQCWYSDYTTGWVIRGSNSGGEKRAFPYYNKHPDSLWGHPASFSIGAWGFLHRNKAAETGHSTLSSATVQNDWMYASTSPPCFHGE